MKCSARFFAPGLVAAALRRQAAAMYGGTMPAGSFSGGMAAPGERRNLFFPSPIPSPDHAGEGGSLSQLFLPKNTGSRSSGFRGGSPRTPQSGRLNLLPAQPARSAGSFGRSRQGPYGAFRKRMRAASRPASSQSGGRYAATR